MFETLFNPNDTLERCGLILDDGSTVEVGNVSAEPEKSYMMDPVAVVPFLERAVGTWHTHPSTDPNLSGEDYKGFLLWPKLEHVIIGLRNGHVAVEKYRVEDGLVTRCD